MESNEINREVIDKVKDQQIFKMANVSNMKIPLAYRPNTSDKWLLGKIFEEQEYNFPIHNFEPSLILDCGANVGYSAAYFSNKYPKAKIIAVEPEPDNFKMLQYNTHFYENVQCIRSALWNKEGYIKILPDMPGNTLAFMTEDTTPDDPEALKTTTISKLLADSGFDEIDLLKIDIEGAEKEVFSEGRGYLEWLPKVKIMMMEIHDRMKIGCSHEVFKAISKFRYFFEIKGENLLFVREDLIAKCDWNGNVTLR